MPESGIILKEPLFLLAWERAMRGGAPFQALGVQGEIMVIRRGFWTPPWYGEYQWLAGVPGRREEIFEALRRDGRLDEPGREERFDLQFKGSPEFPGKTGLRVVAGPEGLKLEARSEGAAIVGVPASVKSFAEAGEILDRYQAEIEARLGRG